MCSRLKKWPRTMAVILIMINSVYRFNAELQEIRSYSYRYAAARKGDSWGFLDRVGRECIQCQYQCVKDFRKLFEAVITDNYTKYICLIHQVYIKVFQYCMRKRYAKYLVVSKIRFTFA